MQDSGPSRRSLLQGQFASRPEPVDEPSIHISSAIVSVMPNRREEMVERLSLLPGIEVHHIEAHKIVIVLEADEAGVIGIRLAEIATWNGVLSANMVYETARRLSEIGD